MKRTKRTIRRTVRPLRRNGTKRNITLTLYCLILYINNRKRVHVLPAVWVLFQNTVVDKIPSLWWVIHMSRNGSVPSVFSSTVNWIAITCHSLTRSYKYWVMETMTQSMLGIRQKYVINKRESLHSSFPLMMKINLNPWISRKMMFRGKIIFQLALKLLIDRIGAVCAQMCITWLFVWLLVSIEAPECVKLD